MGAFSLPSNYFHLQSNFRHCAEELARLEFEIEFSNIEEGTPIPPSFPTPFTYWRHGGWSGVSNAPPISPDPLHEGPQTGEPPQLLNISESLNNNLSVPLRMTVMFDSGLIMKAIPTSMPLSWHTLHVPKLLPLHVPLFFLQKNIYVLIGLYVT